MDDVKWRRWTSWAEKKFGPDRAKMTAALNAVSEAYKRGEDGASAARRAEAAVAALDGTGKGGAWGSAASAHPPRDVAVGDGAWAARPPGRWSPRPALRGTASAGAYKSGGRTGVRTAAYAGLCLGALLLLAGSPAGVLLIVLAIVALVYARGR